MSWDYAELAKKAKAAGGPVEYVDKIANESKEVGRIQGHQEMMLWTIFATIASCVSTATVVHFVEKHLRKNKDDSQAALEQAKIELIQGIKEFEASHPEDSGENE